jgi:hypothetical protein
MPQLTTAGRLLLDVQEESPALCDAVIRAAGIASDRAEAAMHEGARLSLSEQLRLSEAAALMAPRHARTAVRLRGQVIAARSFENGDLVERQPGPGSEKWERSSHMRR